MFNFGDANKEQKEAITTIEGPLLIIAGPGTGKTFTLVKRIVYLVVEKNIKPEKIMIATFTEKAAKEIITRISNELSAMNINININEMYIGTFHSICLRILKENLEFTKIKKNYKLLDQFEQQYIIFQNIYKFRQIENFEFIFNRKMSAWRQSIQLASYINNISEELVDIDSLINDSRKNIEALGRVYNLYSEILEEENYLDFAQIQIKVLNLLKNNNEILTKLKEKIKYIMVDEYQDTNYIQEQLLFLLINDEQNLCVVGDDDQGLYRFRGATIRNILEFPDKFDVVKCRKIYLTKNYRSDKGIIKFYNNWMSEENISKFNLTWGKFRFKKEIEPALKHSVNSSSVIKVSGENFDEEWYNEVFKFINKLKKNNKITDYNQIAFLFKSVKGERVTKLANFLEKNGINVYSPRSDMFFKRDEIKIAIAIIILLFPTYVNKLNNDEFKYLSKELRGYYINSINKLIEYITNSKNQKLLKWMQQKSLEHINFTKNMDYSFSGLLYEIFQFEPFKSILSRDLDKGVIDSRPLHNLAILSNIIARYEYLHRLNVFTPSNIEKHTENFFNLYLRFLYDGGIEEFEDESEYAPSGCVSFLTIHQSKGMEFPIVIVGSLNSSPKEKNDILIDNIKNDYYHRKGFEPKEYIKYYDFWRLYYTAFSRAKNLLVLTCCEKRGRGQEPNKYFNEIYNKLPYYNDEEFDVNKFEFDKIKKVNLKQSYSFTSHILLYENCSLQYKFYKELGFTPVRVGATLFGTLVHQTIEDIHRAAIRSEIDTINTENIEKWFNNNYISIVRSERAYLAEPQKQAALKQVLMYADKQKDNWKRIRESEVDVSLVKENYILKGTIDLIKGVGNSIELIDFKSEKKPDLVKEREKIEQYRKQLEVYAYIIEKRTGCNISKLHLYYTGELNGVPEITFDKKNESIDETINEFDEVVCKIQDKNYIRKSKSEKICQNCDMRFFCK